MILLENLILSKYPNDPLFKYDLSWEVISFSEICSLTSYIAYAKLLNKQ